MEEPKPHVIYKENLLGREVRVEHVMKDVKERVQPILSALKQDIEQNKIGMVLGIDASGRIPALLLAQAIQYKNDVEVRFVTGNKNVDYEDRVTRLEELKQHFSSATFQGELGEREILLVDDIVASGISVELTAEALRACELPYRLVTLSLEDSELASDKETIEVKISAPIITGETNSVLMGTVPGVHGKHQMAGVKKGVGMFSKSINKTAFDAEAVGDKHYLKPNYEVLQRTRELINQYARSLAEEMGWI
jgi:pyrimidine operon attenuation protein/uracil phosphoribosyltransferase